ncbi:uncharacterized protein CLUP02_09865 [Colletotrichum lupini]|uniref:Uncharacterized protein n=1 Tax=Colletotrichum lupini TaxID=145971 RepID=A0A9Q8WI86_9PEZI|nr:uncharacterized protein CLUP02_09865 [Colletotrichum lupini]UQC84369.1 hypothetical protein CLUP02_09865 [Colletotrichum lupini]
MLACPRASETLAAGPPSLVQLGSVPVPESSCRSARSGHSVRLVGFSSPPFRFGAPLISPHLLRPFISQLQPRPQQPPGHPIRGNHHQSSLSFSRKISIVLLNIVSSFVFPFVAGLLISASSRVSLVSGFHPLRLSPCVKCYCTVVSFRKNVCSLCVGIGKPPPRRRP